jgi:hypothetical protein
MLKTLRVSAVSHVGRRGAQRRLQQFGRIRRLGSGIAGNRRPISAQSTPIGETRRDDGQ